MSQSERNSTKGCITCEKDGTATAQDWWKRRPAPHNTQIHAYTCIDTFITRSAWLFLHGNTVDGTSLILMCIQVYNIPKESGDAPCRHKARLSPFSSLSLFLFFASGTDLWTFGSNTVSGFISTIVNPSLNAFLNSDHIINAEAKSASGPLG